MALRQSSAPAVEPVSLAEVKAFLRVDSDTHDAFLLSLITTSRLHIEASLDLALISQGFVLTQNFEGQTVVEIEVHPVQSITLVRASANDGSFDLIDLDAIEVDTPQRPTRLTLPSWTSASMTSIEVEFAAGFGATAANVPGPIRQALLLLIAHWFENREPVAIGTTAARIPTMVSELLAPYRRAKL